MKVFGADHLGTVPTISLDISGQRSQPEVVPIAEIRSVQSLWRSSATCIGPSLMALDARKRSNPRADILRFFAALDFLGRSRTNVGQCGPAKCSWPARLRRAAAIYVVRVACFRPEPFCIFL